jgi:phage I-like protein
MGVIYLQHAKHGIHVATTEEEAADCRTHGWADWAPGDAAPVSPNKPAPDTKLSVPVSEMDALKAQMAALTAQLAALAPKPDVAAPKPETKVDPKAKAPAPAAPPPPDFLDVLKPQG